jgi:hypothetical protein
MRAAVIYFVEGRVPFIPPADYVPPLDTKTGRRKLSGNNHGSAVLLYSPYRSGDPIIKTYSPKHIKEFKLEDYLANCPEFRKSA